MRRSFILSTVIKRESAFFAQRRLLSAVVYYASRFHEGGRSVKVGYPPAHKRVESAPYGAFGEKRSIPLLFFANFSCKKKRERSAVRAFYACFTQISSNKVSVSLVGSSTLSPAISLACSYKQYTILPNFSSSLTFSLSFSYTG